MKNVSIKIELVEIDSVQNRKKTKKKQENFILYYFFSLYKFHRKSLHGNVKELPGISIIKPLTGIDGNLYENLKTFFNLQYPRVCRTNLEKKNKIIFFTSVLFFFFQYEILFCIQEHNAELVDMLDRLRAQYPRIESQIFIRKSMKRKTR